MITNEELIVKFRESNEDKWMEMILENNKALIESILKKKKIYVDRRDDYFMEDLRQEGYVAIWESVKDYNFGNKTKFTTFAYKKIDGAMNTYIRKNASGKIVVPYEALRKYKLYLDYIKRYQEENAREPTEKEILEHTKLEKKDFDLIYKVKRANNIGSYEQEVEKSVENDNFVRKILQKETYIEIMEEIDKTLDDKKKSILFDSLIYDRKLVDLKEKYNLTPQGIGKIRKEALKKLSLNEKVIALQKQYYEVV